MMKLYYGTAAISLVTHIALEECALPYSLHKVALREGEQYGETYKRVHPLSRVPALVLESGETLTETPALLAYLAEQVPERELLPPRGLARARANEWMSLFASTVHVHFFSFFRPERHTSDAAAKQVLSTDGKARFDEALRYVEARLPEQPFILGERYSLCDAYALVFYLWAVRFELGISELPRYSRLARAVLAREPVRRALDQEGLSKAYAG